MQQMRRRHRALPQHTPICLGCSAFLERENEERKAMQKAKNAAAAGVLPEDLKKSG